ncbi:Rrf2 family transcriptional regulator [Candidatus Bipolaricaulota bacterium]|nr:Rrf2 family transcriptional regulator [Candidatus Bipolaricaulota bacterium]
MIISNRLGYGVRILYDLATTPNRYRSARELAEDYHVAEAFIRRILMDLRRAGVVTAQKGRTGGYVLGHDPQAIKLGQVVKALEAETPALVYGRARGGGYLMDQGCPTFPFWKNLEVRFVQELTQSTLADVMELVGGQKAKQQPKPRRRTRR